MKKLLLVWMALMAMGVAVAQPVVPPKPLPFFTTTSGKTCNVGPGALTWADGSTTTYAAKSCTLLYDAATNATLLGTNYIVLNYADGTLHSLCRKIGDGEQLIATVILSNGVATSVAQPLGFIVPPTQVGRYKSKMLAGVTNTVMAIGDSTTQGVPNNYVMWEDFLWNRTYASSNYNTFNAANTLVLNYGVGGTTSEYGLAILGKSFVDAPSSSAAWGSFSLAIDAENAVAAPAVFSTQLAAQQVLSGPSRVWQIRPDLITVGFGVNGCRYNTPCLEGIARNILEDHPGVDVLWITQNDGSAPSLGNAFIGVAERQLADQIGGAVADTWGYMFEQTALGNVVLQDSIHPNQFGEVVWTWGIGGVLNSHAQTTRVVTPSDTRVIQCATASESPLFGWQIDFVGGTPPDNTSATAITTNTFGGGNQFIPWTFGYTAPFGYNVPTGGKITYAHHMWNWAVLFIERGGATNGFTATISYVDTGGVRQPVSTNSYVDGSVHLPGIMDVVNITQMLPGMTNLFSGGYYSTQPITYNGGLEVAVTAGNAHILGVGFGGPRHKPVILHWPFNGVQFVTATAGTNTFGRDTDTSYGLVPNMMYSDTLNDAFSIGYTGRGLYIANRRGAAGGQLSWTSDYKSTSTKDMYAPGTTRAPYMIQYVPGYTAGGDFARGLGPHIFTMQYYGQNGSQAAPTNGFTHAVNIIAAEVLY